MTLVIGLTGTIAAGKSTVATILVERGATHCDADKLVHRLYDPGTPGFDRVVEAFGRDVVGPDGYVDRKILGAKVFGKPEEMGKLTRAMGSITDAIHAEIDKWRANLGEHDVAVMEAVNLMEPGYARWCDQTWVIRVDDEVARQRMIKTRGMTIEEANQRLASMKPFEEREPGVDWHYANNGTTAELDAAVVTELQRIVALHKADSLPASKFGLWWEDFIAKNRPMARARGEAPAGEQRPQGAQA
ncbi:MAG TPA: dephospho-CoA kinase [Tepidiformaceae bacterium]